jgi:RNA polymerase sigma-70 factor (ECF subfamily)
MLYRLTIDTHTAADLLQDLFLHLARARGFCEAADPVACAYRAAMNLAWNQRRSRTRHPASELRIEPRNKQLSPSESAIQREECQRVLDGLAMIPAGPREVFILRHIEQRPYEEVALRLNMSSHTARALAHRATRLLRDLLNSDSERKDHHVRYDRT